VTIDWPWAAEQVERLVTVEDCERVTRQLQYVLEVEGVDYQRLEVSSPGIDRPLRHAQDFERFEGEVVDLVLKAPIGAAAAGQVAANRKKFRGTLQRRRRLAHRVATSRRSSRACA
jgi:ribosome maturation factor RimP